MKTAKILMTILAMVVCANMFAQTTLPSACTVWLPKKIDSEVIKKADAMSITKAPYGQNITPSQKHFWVVYSDRDNNVTYQYPRTNSPKFSQLSFNERLIIAKIENGYALVYSEPKIEKYPRISSAAKSRGWVPMSNLLLWTKGLTDEAYVSYKAVICANLDAATNEAEGKLYYSPNGKAVGGLTTDMQFYFVMKEEGGKSLLATSSMLSSTPNSGLYGWVDKNSYVPWNHRVCLEPTWDKSNVEWFKQNDISCAVYPEIKNDSPVGNPLAQWQFSTNNNGVSGPWGMEYIYRNMPPTYLRYPMLEGSTKTFYHVSAFGSLGSGGSTIGQPLPDDIKAIESQLNNLKQIRIGLLIDGTKSMEAYFPHVQNAIIEGCKYFDEYSNVQVAAAIYRDREDKEYVFESFPSVGGFTSSNNVGLMNWLKRGGNGGVKSNPADKDEEEALYYGMKMAVERFMFDPNHSNLLIVVGDCGDSDKMGVGREEVIKVLADKNVNLMAFQVRNKDRNAFQTFVSQLVVLMTKSLEMRYANKGNKENEQDNRVEFQNRAVIVGQELADKTGWDIFNKQEAEADYCLYRYVCRRKHLNGEMSIDELSHLMEKSIAMWDDHIERLETIIEEFYKRGPWIKSNREAHPFIYEELVKRFGKERVDRLLNGNPLMSFRGWTYRVHKDSYRDFWKTVVFLPEAELRTLIEKLEPVYDVVRTQSNRREPFVDAITALVEALAAQKMSEISAKELPYNKAIALIFGLNDTVVKDNGYTIEDIADPNVVSQTEYIKLCNKMSNSIHRLKRIHGTDYPFIYKPTIREKYYWLPSEDLPLSK